MGRLFGTDGVRGLANAELTPELALSIAVAAAHVLREPHGPGGPDLHGRRPAAVVGRDGRASGEMLEAAVVAGLTSAGADVLRAGVLPTPAVAHLTAEVGADLGVVLSASHNPMPDNGIKLFARGGLKLPDAVEDEIELRIGEHWTRPTGAGVGRARDLPDAAERYTQHLLATLPTKLDGLRVVVDCAHGAASAVAPLVLSRAGAEVTALAAEPDGRNINDGVGSTHLDGLVAAVRGTGADVGVAFDGDADRCFIVDENGTTVSGDLLATLVAKNVLEKESGATIIYSAVCSKALPELVRREGGKPIRTKAGHSIIKPQMRKNDAAFGGEHSGHFYFRDNYFADSGIIAMLIVAELVARQDSPLSELLDPIDLYVRSGEINSEVEDQSATLEGVENHYAERDGAEIDHLDGLTVGFGDWWFNLRPSNTEPLLRLNVEANDRETMERERDELLDLIRG